MANPVQQIDLAPRTAAHTGKFSHFRLFSLFLFLYRIDSKYQITSRALTIQYCFAARFRRGFARFLPDLAPFSTNLARFSRPLFLPPARNMHPPTPQPRPARPNGTPACRRLGLIAPASTYAHRLRASDAQPNRLPHAANGNAHLLEPGFLAQMNLRAQNYFSSLLFTLVRESSGFSGNYPLISGLTLTLYLTIMVHSPKVSHNTVRKRHPGDPALALRTRPMATIPVSVEAREVLRCEFCRLMQFRTSNCLCRRCRRPLDLEEPVRLAPQLVSGNPASASTEAGLQVAAQVREIRRARHLSQRQLAGRMQVPRTYISKIENGKAIPTLGSLERLASALEVDLCQLIRDSRSRRDEEVAAILSDPFLAEIASVLAYLEPLQRTLIYGAVRDAAAGRRRSA